MCLQIAVGFSLRRPRGWKDLKCNIELDSISPKEGGQHAKNTLFIFFLSFSVVTPCLCLKSADKTGFESGSVG
jgi:hypothetical protein